MVGGPSSDTVPTIAPHNLCVFNNSPHQQHARPCLSRITCPAALCWIAHSVCAVSLLQNGNKAGIGIWPGGPSGIRPTGHNSRLGKLWAGSVSCHPLFYGHPTSTQVWIMHNIHLAPLKLSLSHYKEWSVGLLCFDMESALNDQGPQRVRLISIRSSFRELLEWLPTAAQANISMCLAEI